MNDEADEKIQSGDVPSHYALTNALKRLGVSLASFVTLRLGERQQLLTALTLGKPVPEHFSAEVREAIYRDLEKADNRKSPEERAGPWYHDLKLGSLMMHHDISTFGHCEMMHHALQYGRTVYKDEYSGYAAPEDLKNLVRDLGNENNLRLLHTDAAGYHIYIDHESLLTVAYDPPGRNDNHIAKGPSTPLTPEGMVQVTARVRSFDSDATVGLINSAKSMLRPNNEDGVVSAITSNGHSLGTRDIGKIRRPLIRENYDEEVLLGYDKILQSLGDNEPSGRLSIIYGEPGTGKTHLIQGLINDATNVDTWLLQPDMLRDLGGPQILNLLLERRKNRPLLLVIEDGDTCLINRMSDNMSGIQALLNATDGIIGQLMNIHIVATTNWDKLDIDKALLRPGRLQERIRVGGLDSEQAMAVYQRLTAGRGKFPALVSSKTYTLAEIYSMARGYA